MSEETIKLSFTLNGKKTVKDVNPLTTLLDFLRQEMVITSVKRGCESGECGACTVLIDNEPVPSCLVPVSRIKNSEITTIEGLSLNGRLHPIQEAFLEADAVQCGYCTPGMILTTKALLDKNPKPNEEDIRKALEGNLCRCTGYLFIFEAIRKAAQILSEKNNHHVNN